MNLKIVINLRVAGLIKRYLFMVCISCLLAASLPRYSFSFFDNFGARPQALSGAYVALADDASAVFLNPAGIAQSNKLQALIYYTNMFPSISEWNMQSGGLATSFATYGNVCFGVGYAGLSVGKGFYQETVTSIPAAYTFLKNENTSAYLGLSMKFLTIGYGNDIDDYSQGDPVFASESMTKFTSDFGLLLVNKIDYTKIQMGFVIQNMKKADFGVIESDYIYPEYHIGFGAIIESHEVESELLSILSRLSPKILTEFSVYKYTNDFSIATELTYKPISLQLGIGKNAFSFGFSIQALKQMRIDIGSKFYLQMSGYSPQMGLNYGW